MYKLQKKDIEQASITLALAFAEYPVFTYLLPDKYDRDENLKYIFQFLLRLGFMNGEVHATSNHLEGISIWYSSKDMNASLFDIVRSGIINLNRTLNKNSFQRFIYLNKFKTNKRHELLKDEEYSFLDAIGVHPSCQMAGHGLQLLTSKVNENNKRGVTSYLETSNKKNIDYYTKIGFSLLSEYAIENLNVYCLIAYAGNVI